MNNKSFLSETIKTMHSHRSVRKFKATPIPREHFLEIIRAGQSASSSHFVQAYSIILISDQEKRSRIAEYANNPDCVNKCPIFLLFCADMKRLEYAVKNQGAEFQYDTVENFIVCVVDTAIIAENVITAAESLGYGGCYIGGVRNNPGLISDIAGLPDKVFPLLGMSLGIPDEDNEIKPRLPLDAILHENKYDESKYNRIIKEYDCIIQRYYSSRTQNKKSGSWSETMASYLAQKNRSHMKDFLQSKGYHLDQ